MHESRDASRNTGLPTKPHSRLCGFFVSQPH